MKQQGTLFDKVISKIKNNRVVAILMAIGIIVITLSTFTDAVKNLLNSITGSHITAEAARIKLGQMSLIYTPEVFISSTEKGDIEAVKLFLAAGMNPDVTDTEECTALIHAVRGQNIPLIDLLIKAGADINKKCVSDMTALGSAARRGNKKIVELLLDNGADSDSMNQAFLKAASSGHFEILRLLLDRGVKVDQIKSRALLEATHPIEDGILIEVINFLLDLGADVNTKDEDGWTPLLQAALHNSEPAVIQALLASGADVNARCECPGYFHGGWSALMLAAQGQSSEIIKILLGTGADINARDNEGQTALIKAAKVYSRDQSEIVEILLSAGTDINVRDNEGRTALMKAAEPGNMGVVQVLIDKGADVNIQDNEGRTALAWALYLDRVDIVHALIKRHREVNH